MSRAFEVQVGSATVPCRLPLMPTRLAIVDAIRATNDMSEAQRGFVQPVAFAAALASCMAVPPQCGSLARHRGDVVAYGEAAADELCDGDPRRLGDIIRAGGECFRAILDSLPTQAEVDDAALPTGAPAEPSTGAT